MDFAQVKSIAREYVVDLWDHAFLVYREDRVVMAFLESMPDHKTVVLNTIPTVENLARTAFAILAPRYAAGYGGCLRLIRVRLYETPNCWADASTGE